ncbi:DUF4345 domain-containing protein [Dinoroseobacter sp. S375]|uniref:DUF4345 domain-containing protein n=1 Tax=Dinoroseobacter sp. S375 TaxID=3415136 RepID=UPI003C7DCFD8
MSTLARFQPAFLTLAAVGLTPIALGYGAAPNVTLPWMFGIDASAANTRHIFRAVMGLYLALALFWLMGARKPDLRIPALWSLVIFMGGLAAGRALSLLLDGLPHPLLLIYLFLELGFCALGWKLLTDR